MNNKENKAIASDWNLMKNRYDSKANYQAKSNDGITITYSV